MTNKIDTDTALKWSKSFTLDLSDWFCLPISFLLDEEKKMALFYSKSRELTVYTIGEDDDCYKLICCEVDSKYTPSSPYILNYVPSLVQIHQ